MNTELLFYPALLIVDRALLFAKLPGFAPLPSGISIVQVKMSVEHWWNGNDRGKQNTGRKICLCATLYTTDPTRTDLSLKLTLSLAAVE